MQEHTITMEFANKTTAKKVASLIRKFGFGTISDEELKLLKINLRGVKPHVSRDESAFDYDMANRYG